MTDAQINEYRAIFVIATTALFAAIIGIVQLTELVSHGFVHTFWPVAGAGIVLSVVWFWVLGDFRGTLGTRNSGGPSRQVHRAFDQALPLVLVFIWSWLMWSWGERHPPLIHGLVLWLAVGGTIVVFLLWILLGPDISGRRSTNKQPLPPKLTIAFRCLDCGSTWTFSIENPASFERCYQNNRECLSCGSSNIEINPMPLTGTRADEDSGKSSGPLK
jgi:hypothetical protein